MEIIVGGPYESGLEAGLAQQVHQQRALFCGRPLFFEENTKGSIEPGKLADFVVISKDFLSCAVDEIKEIEALRTVVDGKVVYNSSYGW